MRPKQVSKLLLVGLLPLLLGSSSSQSQPAAKARSEFAPGYPGPGKINPLTHEYTEGEYRAPRFPSYLKNPKSVDEVMPFARAAVRQTRSVQGGLGLVNSGETVLIIVDMGADPIILEAVDKAFEERGVTVQYLPRHQAAGVSEEDARRLHEWVSWAAMNHWGLAEVDRWFGFWDDKNVPKEWLKGRRPDLYDVLYEKLEQPPDLVEIQLQLENQAFPGIVKYLDAHPEVDAVCMGKGGMTSQKKGLGKYHTKMRGLFLFDNAPVMTSRVGSFPGDLWQMIEERTIEPIAWLDRVQAWDPEGTDVYWDMTEEEAQVWARGIYLQGHLYMNPRQATGRFPYSVLEFPAFQNKWLPPIITKTYGTYAGCSNHAGKFDRTAITLEDGYIKKVEGQGKYAEIWEYVRANYPNINDLTYPYYPKPGYFWQYEAGLGTNPKFALARGNQSGERLHAGVVHWAFGAQMHHTPEAPVSPPELKEFTRKNKLPWLHWMHIHNLFVTYNVRVRNANKWITIIDKGRLTALDDPAVRALASRYGDPDDLLADEWIEDMPGINRPGSYAEYAKDPREHLMNVMAKVENGTYEYFYTPPSMRKDR